MKRKPRVEVFRATRLPNYMGCFYRGDYRWRVRAANGRVIASSGEGYSNRAHCLRMVRQLFPSFQVKEMER